MVRTRRDVWKLDEWDDALLWYAKAVREMSKRKIADPTSWRYQAAIHEYDESGDPLQKPSDVLPPQSEQDRFWNQCQHGTWYFLPWHRWYLHYFELIVGAAIVKLGGPREWALPYWNYGDASNPNALVLPPAFRTKKLPDRSDNALYVARRRRGNDGQPVGDARHTDLSGLREPKYEADPPGGSPGFGGPKTVFEHNGELGGVIEDTPHGSIHVRVGGLMAGFNTAGLDPLFWLHHANIDRLWAVWRHRNPNHRDPADRDWLKMSFDFHDASGAAVSRTVGSVVDPEAIGYRYDDISDPLEGGLEGVEVRRIPTLEEEPIPEMIGATEGPVPLKRRATTARVQVSAPSGPGLESVEAEVPKRMFINVENVTGRGEAQTYSVYVNDVYAGLLPMFGVREASRQTDRHAGSGREYRLEVTDIVRQLQAAGDWNPDDLRVTFVPDDEEPGLESVEEEAAEPEFQIGRVSVYVS